jgi:hexosaminidase
MPTLTMLQAAYLLDETIKSNDAAVIQPYLQRFIGKIVDIVAHHGMQPVVWEEMLLDWNLTLPSSSNVDSIQSTLVQVWRDTPRIEEVLKRGHRAIFGDCE